jgi:glycosyltransferase involved in cell wall biosynthesis
MPPLVSIILSTYNRPDKLAVAIKSVFAQTYTDWELLVIDDGSPQEITVPDDPRIKLVRLHPNSGGSYRPRRTGLEMSQGKYIAILDDDTFCVDKDKLKLQVEFMEQNPECELVGTNAAIMTPEHKVKKLIRYPGTNYKIRARMLFRNPFFHSCVMYRRETAVRNGGYSRIKNCYYTDYSFDYELWLKLGTVGKLRNLNIVGAGCINPKWDFSTRNRWEFTKLNLGVIKRYRRYYPNWIKAVVFRLVLVVLEIPPVVRFLRWLRKY